MDMSFLHSYKPVLYPVTAAMFDEQCLDEKSEESAVVSLVALCCQKIVQDGTMTANARAIAPRSLCEELLRAALLNDRDRAVEQLVAGWPWWNLLLRQYLPPMFGRRPLHTRQRCPSYGSEVEMSEHMRTAIKQTTCLAHTFIECLKRHADTKLRYLDLTGYPAAEVIVNYLASHVLLVYNESRQREIIQVYDHITRDLPRGQRREYSFNSTIPDDQFVMCVDALLQTEEAHMELCRALRASRAPSAPLRLRIGKLDMSCLGVPRTVVLLEQLEPEFTTGISLQFNGVTNEGLHVLCPALKPFVNLMALDLAANGIVLTPAETARPLLSELAAAFGALPRLQRLNLSGIRMRECVPAVLGAVGRPLSMLRLSGCGLRRSDLVWLASAAVSSQLEQLDIGANNLAPHVDAVCRILYHAGRTLTVFEAEDADLTPVAIGVLLSTFAELPQLRYVDVSGSDEIGATVVIDTLEKLLAVPRLRVFRISAPKDFAVLPSSAGGVVVGAENSAEFRDVQNSFAWRLTDLLARLCHAHGRTVIRLVFKL